MFEYACVCSRVFFCFFIIRAFTRATAGWKIVSHVREAIDSRQRGLDFEQFAVQAGASMPQCAACKWACVSVSVFCAPWTRDE